MYEEDIIEDNEVAQINADGGANNEESEKEQAPAQEDGKTVLSARKRGEVKSVISTVKPKRDQAFSVLSQSVPMSPRLQ